MPGFRRACKRAGVSARSCPARRIGERRAAWRRRRLRGGLLRLRPGRLAASRRVLARACCWPPAVRARRRRRSAACGGRGCAGRGLRSASAVPAAARPPAARARAAADSPCTSSGGTPCGTPGTPSGNTGLRSPGSGFLVLNQSSIGSALAAAERKPERQHRHDHQATMAAHRDASAFLVGVGQREQHLDLAAGAGRRLGVGEDHVGPAPHRGHVVGAPGRRARASRARCGGRCGRARSAARAAAAIRRRAPCPPASCRRAPRRDPAAPGRCCRRRQADRRSPPPPSDRGGRLRPPRGTWRACGRSRCCSAAILAKASSASLCLPCSASVAAASKAAPASAAFLASHHSIGAPAADRGHDQNASGDEEIAVAIPQLLELFAADFLIDFAKDIGHEMIPSARPEFAGPG